MHFHQTGGCTILSHTCLACFDMSEALHDAHELHGVPKRVKRPERGVDLPRPIRSRLAEVGKVLAVPAEEVVAAGAPAKGGGVAEQGAERGGNRGLFST